jgi:hypothetical protein
MPRSLQKHTKSQIQSQPSTVQVQTSLGQSIKQGFGFGVGSHLAHAILGSTSRPTDHQPIVINAEYKQCMTENNDDKAVCAHLLQKA